jgi:4-amino-4-deoxy-L-arabinose transferase-like glycosyltransferase
LLCLALSLALFPLVWSLVSITDPRPDSNLPHAGPGDIKNRNDVREGELNPFQTAVLQVTLANTDPDAYLLAGLSANQTAPFILATGRPVLALGGFSGNDDIFTPEELITRITSGALRYVLVSQQLAKQDAEFTRWVTNNCQVVPLPGMLPPEQIQRQPSGQQDALYDCRAAG